MSEKESIKLFENHKIRTAWDDETEEWYFSIVDVVAVLTESSNPRKYWSVLKTRLKKEGSELTTNCSQLKMTAADGKKYKTDCVDTEQLFRLIQSIPSPKAEPFKLWVAQVASERIDQLQDPELSINWQVCESIQNYQSENDLEQEFIIDLQNQGYEYLPGLNTSEKMLANVRVQLQTLNNVQFLDDEWQRFVEQYLDKPSDNSLDKTRKIHDDYIHDFVFDDGHIENICLLDKKNIARNKVQAINQFEQTGTQANRYDVTVLVNGLPLVQIELKKRGVAIREAFNQVHRYSKESFNADNFLFKYLQLLVISNGTDSHYFANTTKRDKNNFDFTMNWARSDNTLIKDLKDFTATFFQKLTLLDVLINYSVFDVSNTLLVMRPYQVAATERILWKIKSSYQAKSLPNTESGGFIWHTTGSGKTLTSFKTARLVTKLDFIDKVFFVVDRKDLYYQTMKEYLCDYRCHT